MNDYKVKRDLPMHKDVYFFGHGIDIDNPYEMANEIIDLKRQKQELIDYLKEKENELQKKVVYYEKQLKGTERNSFYYSSYLKNIHKLNAQRELIKEILSKIEKE